MIIRLDRDGLVQSQNNKNSPIGVEGDAGTSTGKVSEAEKIVRETKQKIAEGGTPAVGVSASNSGRGHDPIPIDEGGFKPTALDGSVEEESSSDEDDEDEGDEEEESPKVTPDGSLKSTETGGPSAKES
jgi:protein phosphatase PTC1